MSQADLRYLKFIQSVLETKAVISKSYGSSNILSTYFVNISAWGGKSISVGEGFMLEWGYWLKTYCNQLFSIKQSLN